MTDRISQQTTRQPKPA